jgi:hypothetical protein
MPLDTQTFALSRWWASAGLLAVQSNPALFSSTQVRTARLDLIAGKNQLTAIKNWLLAAQLIKREGSNYLLTRSGKCFFDNDSKFQKSSSWWAFHLLCCLGEDPYPYDALFRSLDTEIRGICGITELKKKILLLGTGQSGPTLDTYLEGILNMFQRDGALEGLGILEVSRQTRGDTQNPNDTQVWRIGRSSAPDGAILLSLALARQRFYVTRSSISFGELISVGIHHYLAFSQDDFRQRLKALNREDHGVSYTTAANLDSLSFDISFTVEKILVTLLQEGADTWM